MKCKKKKESPSACMWGGEEGVAWTEAPLSPDIPTRPELSAHDISKYVWNMDHGHVCIACAGLAWGSEAKHVARHVGGGVGEGQEQAYVHQRLDNISR